MSLEDRIKALMEGKAAVDDKKKFPVQADDQAQDDQEGEEKDEDESDDEESEDKEEAGEDKGAEDKEVEGDTDLAKDVKKKDAVTVKEAATPGQGKDLVQSGSDSEEGGAKTAKVKLGLGKKDAAPGKLADGATADQQSDNGDNAKIKAGLGKKDAGGKVEGEVGGENEDNKRNNVQKNEHIEALFQGEALSEEFQVKAATIFEAAVAQASQSKIEALEEEYALQLEAVQAELEESMNSSIEELVGSLVENVDGYLDFVVEEWVSANQVALEGSIKVELVNSFVDGLKGLFKEHYVDIPEEKVSVIEEQASVIDDLQAQAAKLQEDAAAIRAELIEAKATLVFEHMAVGLTGMQKDKFMGLVEHVEFTTEEDYSEKLATIKESYFPNGKTAEVSQEVTVAPIVESQGMDSYVAAIAKNIKF